MKKYTFVLLSVFILMGCHGTRGIRDTPKEQITSKPNWVDERPLSATYYIGIGIASKSDQNSDFAEVAKNNALNDLASEISVNIQAESFLHVLDVNYHFREDFLSTISATSNEYIEGFERMGTWQDSDSYYVYYRLSKETHDRIKREMKNAVLSQALDLYKLGAQNENQGNVGSALNNYFQALQTMEPYWNEPNEFNVDGVLVHLDNLIYASILDVSNNLSVNHENNIILSSENNFETNYELSVTLRDIKANGIIISYDYDRGKYVRRKEIQTDHNGEIRIPVRHPNIENKENVLRIEVDLSKLIAPDLKTGMMAAVIKKINKIQRQIPIDVVMPKVFIASIERNLDQPMNSKILSNTLKNELLKNNFLLVNDQQTADYFIELGSNTKKMGTSQGFHTSFLTFSIQMIDSSNENVVFQITENAIKGLQLNYTSAGLESYKKGEKKIKREVVPQIIEQLF